MTHPYRKPQDPPPPPPDPMLRVLVVTGALAGLGAAIVIGMGLWDAHRSAAAVDTAASASASASVSAAPKPLPPLKTHVDPLKENGYCHGGWCWEDPYPTGASMLAVTSRPNDAWIAADEFDGSLLMHWDGAKLTPFETSERVTALARGRTTLWATTRAGAIVQWRGSAFVDAGASSPTPLHAIWAVSDDDVWAVGAGGTIVHYDGRGWSSAHSPTHEQLLAVRGRAADDVWAAGHGVILHWNGRAWSVAHAVTMGKMKEAEPKGRSVCGNPLMRVRMRNAQLLEVGGVMPLGPQDVWFAAGSGRAIHWDGRLWSDVSVGEDITGMWAAAPNDAWAVGLRHIRHWDGASWTDAVETPEALATIDGSGPRDVWAVGERGQIFHFDGTKWISLTRSTRIRYDALWVGDGVAWAGGEGGLARRDATGWHEAPPLFTENNAINAIGGTRATDVWAFGRFHEPYHFDGTSWTPSNGATTAVFSVAAPAADDVWAWGGALQHWDGTTWTKSSDAQIVGLWAPAKGVAWATAHPHVDGAKPATIGELDYRKLILLRWEKTDWKEVGPAPGETIGGVGPNEPWIGGQSEVQRMENGAWKTVFVEPPEPPPPPNVFVVHSALRNLLVVSPRDVWVDGPSGTQHWDGAALTTASIPLPNARIFVRGPDVFAYGRGGILRRAP